jgi:stage II sporulation protein D
MDARNHDAYPGFGLATPPAMRRAALLTVLCALLCVPATASAAARFTIKGAGWGHGIGMSQYGAYGQAQIGRNYQQILEHYYRGTVVSMSHTRSIRVLLQASRSTVSFTGATRAGNKALNVNTVYRARPSGTGVVLRNSTGKRVGTFAAPLRISSSRGYVQLRGTALNGVTSGNYRGALELRPGATGGVTAVNALSLDDYVMGVVPGEMPSSWLPEALKAQAVAARSYALTTDAGGEVFDQYPDTRSQVYRGMSSEVASTNAAVRETANQVVTYEGQVAVTYFFSTSGGETENIENVWPGSQPAPYLRGVEDPYDKIAPRHRWKIGPLTRRQVGARFGSLCRGSFRALTVRKRGVSPRIVTADVVCSGGTRRASGSELRSALGLYDSWFRVVRADAAAKRRTDSFGDIGPVMADLAAR